MSVQFRDAAEMRNHYREVERRLRPPLHLVVVKSTPKPQTYSRKVTARKAIDRDVWDLGTRARPRICYRWPIGPAQNWLNPILRAPNDAFLIFCAAAEKHGVDYRAVLGPGRAVELCLARDEACYEIRHRLQMSTPRIGRMIGRDHTTVLASIIRHQRRMQAGEVP